MTDQTDSFIDEVTEELRRDRLFQAFRRYGWIALGLVLLLVGGTAWYEYGRVQATRDAQAFGDALLDAQDAADPVAAVAAVDTAGRPGQAMVQALLDAAMMAEAGEATAAAERLRTGAEAAAGAKGPGGAALLRELALLKAVMEDPAMDLAARDEVLTQLSKPGAPFRLLALEQKAVALIGAGRDADGADLIRRIQEEDGVTEAMRRRLAATLIALGEDAAPDADHLDPAEPAPAPEAG